ncbi:MAG: PAS domain-containing protein [Phycisphaerales bacterium]|nr:PAS domain-containing protein [Phycisphaerales bacterium]
MDVVDVMDGAPSLLEALGEEAALIGSDGRIVWANSQWQRLHGERSDGASGVGHDLVDWLVAGLAAPPSGEAVAETEAERLGDRVETLLSNVLDRRVPSGEIRHIALLGGVLRPLRLRLAAIPGGAIALHRDLTDEESLRQAVLDSDLRLQAAFDILPHGLSICDEQRRVVLQNEISRGRWGDLVGYRLDDAPLPDEVRSDWSSAVHRALGGKMVRNEPRYALRGESRVFDHLVAPLRSGQRVLGVLSLKTDITDRLHTEQQLRERNETERLLFRELDHRVRNNLSALLALLDLSTRRARTVEDLAGSIRNRLRTMAAVHGLLNTTHWTAVSLAKLLRAVTDSDLAKRIAIEGDDVLVPARQVTALGMVFNELLHNSTEHGALGVETGSVAVDVRLDGETPDGTKVVLTWTETGGPPIDTIPVPGSGTELMVGLLRAELRGNMELGFPQEGASHQLLMRLDLSYPGVSKR